VDSLALANQITDVIVDKQGEDVLVLNLQTTTTIADYFVICSAKSRRQLDALQSSIREALKKGDERILPLNMEGTPESGWILLDYGGVIVHLFEYATRAFYGLEELWQNAPVVARIQ
jgi:ribosome-associated protein